MMPLHEMPAHNSPFHRSLPLSSSFENNVVSTCLYKASASQLDVHSSEASPSTAGILSPRTLYAQYFDSSAINGREAKAGHRFRKDLNVLTGYDTTGREEEFDALPVSVRRKYFSTLERLRFAQGSRSSTPDDSHAKEFLSHEPRSMGHYRDYKSSGTLDITINDHHLKMVSNSREIPSLAERRGKRLERLKLRRTACSEPQHQIQGSLTSAASVLSYQPSLLKATDDKPLSRGNIVKPVPSSRGLDNLDTTGRTIRRKSPISHSHILSPKKENSFQSPNRGTQGTQHVDTSVRFKPRIPNSLNLSTSSLSYIRDPSYRKDNEVFNPKSPSSSYFYASLNKTSSPTGNQNMRPSARRLTSASNLPCERVLISSSRSPYLDYLPSPCLSARSRAHSSANLFSTTLNSEEILKNHEYPIKKAMTLPRSNEAQQLSPVKINTQAKSLTASSSKPAPITMKSFSRDNTTNPFDSSMNNKTSSISEDYTSGKESFQSSPREDLSQEILDYPLSSRQRRSHTTSYDLMNMPNNSQGFSHSGTTKPMVVKKIDSALASGTNQMTLRMTLTRPDLRLDEAKIYAWQDSKFPCQDQQPTEIFDEKYECKGPLGGPDGWGVEEKESGVVKRLWNKVTHTRKVLTV